MIAITQFQINFLSISAGWGEGIEYDEYPKIPLLASLEIIVVKGLVEHR